MNIGEAYERIHKIDKEIELEKHDVEIRVNAIRKFAIWLDEHGYMRKMDLNISRVDEALFEYEKEQTENEHKTDTSNC